jgi:PHD/YefM family antitoxin component YafN of YafNO toxin-antitoxin module
MKTEVEFKRGQIIEENSIWEITNHFNITEQEIIQISNSHVEDNDKKNKETKINIFTDKLYKSIENIEESKRPIIMVNNKIYMRNIVELDHYEWNEERISYLIESLEREYVIVKNNKTTISNESSFNCNNIIYATLVETDYKKILKSLMPLIQKGK